VSGKDIVLELLRRWGAKQSQGMSVELVDANKQLPIAYRNTIANMMAEGEALNGIFAPDDITYAWYRAKGIAELPYPPFAPGVDAQYAIDETIDLRGVMPMIAKPFSPGNAFPADEVARAVEDGEGVRRVSGIGRRRPADRTTGPAARRRVDCEPVPFCRRSDPPVMVRALLRPGARRARKRSTGDHVVQSQLAESHGPRR
jgi:aconitase A